MQAIRPLSVDVVDTVAAAEDIEPTDLKDPLHSVIDPDALNTLFRTDTGRLAFEYHGYSVTVHATGEVEVDPMGSG